MTDLIIQQIDFLHTSAKIFLFSGLKLIHSRAEAFVYHHPKIDGLKVPQIVSCRADGAVGFHKSTTYSAPGVTSLALGWALWAVQNARVDFLSSESSWRVLSSSESLEWWSKSSEFGSFLRRVTKVIETEDSLSSNYSAGQRTSSKFPVLHFAEEYVK